MQADGSYHAEVRTQLGRLVAVATANDRSEAEANARLIAASDRMLLMLKRCVERIQYWENPLNVVSAVQLDALDLIAEVEGR
jgi:hypothetical protein